MKLTFLGSGSAFTTGSNNYHSNMLLEQDPKKRLLIDCGSDVRLSLHELGLSYKDIQDVYISHLHADHVGGLEWLAFTTKFDKECKKPNLYICERLVTDLWQKVLSGGLSSLQGETAELSTYFHIHSIKENHSFTWHNLKFHLIQTMHVMAGFSFMPSFGLMFNIEGINVFITTDTQFAPHQIKEFYDKADLIFQDCETSKNKSNVHAHYEELSTLPKSIRQKMWLYHYNPGSLPDAIKEGFRGFVKKGQCFNFKDKSTL